MMHCHVYVSAGGGIGAYWSIKSRVWYGMLHNVMAANPGRTQSEGAAYVGSFVHAARGAGIWSGPRGTNLLDSGSPVYDTYRTKVRSVT
jgi:hypothetical protein